MSSGLGPFEQPAICVSHCTDHSPFGSADEILADRLAAACVDADPVGLGRCPHSHRRYPADRRTLPSGPRTRPSRAGREVVTTSCG